MSFLCLIAVFKHISQIAFHAFFLYFTNSCFHQKNAIWVISKIEINRDVIHFSNFRESFYMRKCFANNNNNARTNEILYGKVTSRRVMDSIKKGLDFTFSIV